MGWLKKQLKRTTKILDPVGHQLRKSTGGSYGDPMNWYSKPKTAPAYQARTSPGLMSAPAGAPPPGISFGQNTGGYNYLPNRFTGQGAPAGGNMGAPLAGGQNMTQPPMGAMSFGGPRDAMAQTMQQPQQQPYQPQQPQQIPQMQNQMARIGALRGGGFA